MDGYSAYRTSDLVEAYDASYGDCGDIDMWRAMARTAGGGPILELACGTGRVLLPLALDGYEVTGLDLSPHMLDRCRAKLDALPLEVRDRTTLVCGDMTTFELERRYAAIFCTFNSFHHLRTAQDQVACLERCHAHLAPQGLLVLDLFNADPAPAKGQVEAPATGEPIVECVDWTDGRRVRRWMSKCDYDRAAQSNECEMTYEIVERDGATRQLTETFPLRLVYRYELEHLLARCGFRLITVFGDYQREPYREESLGMIAVALSL